MQEKYAYRVIWSQEDEEWVGLCTEFPSLSWLAPEAPEALAGIQKVVGEVVTEMRARGEVPPEPLSLKEYSGRFVVRTTPDTHRRLAMEAAEQKVSLNRLVNSRL